MSDASKAVFLSYASQDAEAAKRICDALRQAGVEVWFDQSELVGGDAWDAKIRRQIKDCALLIPIISANTQARTEGYFRLEWRLADQRTHLMAKGRPFLLPVVIDGTTDADAAVPDSFAEVQWTKAPGGDAPPAFAARVRKMVGVEVSQISDVTQSRGEGAAFPSRGKVVSRVPAAAWIGISAVLGLGIAGWVGLRPTPKVDVMMKPPPVASEAVLTEAQQLLEKIAAIVEKDADAGREDWLLAENLGAQVVKLEPANAEAWAAYSRVALGRFLTGDFLQDTSFMAALQRARQAVALGPDSTEAKLALALAYTMESKTRTEAETILRPLLEQHPKDRGLWRARGTLAQLQKRYDEALTFYDRADASPGGDPVSCRLKAALLSGLGRYDEAERSIERSLELRPGPAAHLMMLIFLATVRDDLPQACVLLEKLPGSYFLRDDTTYCAVQLWIWNREPAKAARLLAGWRENYIGESPKGTALGQAYQLMGRAEAAQQAWRSALALVEKEIADMVAGSDPTNYYAKARLLALLGDKAAAEEAARLWEQSDVNAVGGQNKAALLVLLGKNEEALAALPKQPWNGLASHAGSLGRLSPGGASYRYDPIWDPLRGDPRFEKLAAGYRTMWGHASGSKSATGNDAKSVAVLAFANLSDDKTNEYFSDGISEELLNVLAKVPGLKVTARTSSFHFKGKDTPIPEIARQLGVAYVVEGSVRKSGDKVRITAQLIKAADGFHVWSDTFTRDLKDIFAVQDEIAGLVAQQLQLKLGTARTARVVNPQAYQQLLEARYYWNQRGEESFDRAESLLKQALAIDPEFPEAHASMAGVWAMRAANRVMEGAQDVSSELRNLRASAQRASALDPALADPPAVLAYAFLMEGRWREAELQFFAALARSPDDPTLRYWYGLFLQRQGKYAAARQEYSRARQLDPKSFIIALTSASNSGVLGRLDEAVIFARQADALRPGGFIPALGSQASYLWRLGRTEEAVTLARSIRKSWPQIPRWTGDASALWVLRQAHLEAEVEEYAQVLLKGGLAEQSYLRGNVLTILDRFEDALPYLEFTSTMTSESLVTSVIFDSYRDDPRFRALIEKLHLTEQYVRARAEMQQAAAELKK